MNFEDRLRDHLTAAAGRPAQVPSWSRFAPSAHRRLRLRRLAATGVTALIGVAALSAYAALAPSVQRAADIAERPETLVSNCGSAEPPSTGPLGAVALLRGTTAASVDVTSRNETVLVDDARPADDGGGISFSPSGAWVAIDGRRLVPARGGEPCLPAGSEAHSLVWSPAEDVVAVQRADGLWVGPPDGSLERVVGGALEVTSFIFDSSGDRLALAATAADGERLVMVAEIDGGSVEEIKSYGVRSGVMPKIAGWSPDGEWILYWTEFDSASLSADGAPLVALGAGGGRVVQIVDVMLTERDLLAWCGETLVASAGGGRSITEGKRLITADGPGWSPSEIAEQPGGSVFYPDCASNGTAVTATFTENRFEPRFGVAPRRLTMVGLDGDASVNLGPGEGGRWSKSGNELLFVRRRLRPLGFARLMLGTIGSEPLELAPLGRVASRYGDYDYDLRFDWFQP